LSGGDQRRTEETIDNKFGLNSPTLQALTMSLVVMGSDILVWDHVGTAEQHPASYF